MEPGERLMSFRKSLGLSRRAFAERMGVSGDVINNLERGRVPLKNPMLNLIAKTYNVNPNWLLCESDKETIVGDELLNDLVGKYDLSDNDLILVERFLKLSKTQRDAVVEYLKQIAEGFTEKESESNLRTMMHETVDKQLDLEKEAGGKSEDSRYG